MALGTILNIPDFKAYDAGDPNSIEDAAGKLFYACQGWYKEVFGTYVFFIASGKVTQVVLTPQPTTRGTLEVSAGGLVLTCTTADKQPIRYPILAYVGGGTVVTGGAADQQARDALAKLQSRLDANDVVDKGQTDKNTTQDTRLVTLEKRLSTEEKQAELTIGQLKDFLWNDRFLTDLLYDIIHNRKDKGIRDSIAEIVHEVVK